METLSPGKEVLSSLQTMKGLLFVVLSALLVFVLTKRAHAARLAAEAEKLGGDPATAAWTMVANVLLNLDETITKE